MSLSVSRNKLLSSLKELHMRWDRVQMEWDDVASRKFSEEFLAPLDGKVRATVSAIEHINEMVMKARSECR
jgi:hypothetical protein